LDEVVSEGRDDELIGELMNHVLDGGRLLSTVHLHQQILVHEMQMKCLLDPDPSTSIKNRKKTLDSCTVQ
jgi:hypothetical protein